MNNKQEKKTVKTPRKTTRAAKLAAREARKARAAEASRPFVTINFDETDNITEAVEDDHHYSINKKTMLAMVIFAIGYMISEPNLDGFNIQETLDYLSNETVDSIPVHLSGFIMSFIANIPLLAAIIYCWIRKSHHHHSDSDAHQHEHSILQELIEFLMIGGPFALMGTAAYLDALEELVDVHSLTTAEKVLAYSGSGVSGFITAFGAFKLHGFHVHDAMQEHGGGFNGFWKGIYSTFIKNVWAAKDEEETRAKKVMAVLNEIWKKYGIVLVHGFLGNFAINVFLDKTGLGGRVPSLDLALKIVFPIPVMLYEGNTEARSLDALRSKKNDQNDSNSISYSLYSKLIVTISGILHTIPSVTAMAMIVSSFDSDSEDNILDNFLVYMACGLLLFYPSVYGFAATTISGFDSAAKGIKHKLSQQLSSLGLFKPRESSRERDYLLGREEGNMRVFEL